MSFLEGTKNYAFGDWVKTTTLASKHAPKLSQDLSSVGFGSRPY